jgi:hypothetical protein
MNKKRKKGFGESEGGGPSMPYTHIDFAIPLIIYSYERVRESERMKIESICCSLTARVINLVRNFIFICDLLHEMVIFYTEI